MYLDSRYAAISSASCARSSPDSARCSTTRMSESPQMPCSPDSPLRIRFISLALISGLRSSMAVTTEGSRSPLRVPMTRPASGV